jgi:hypothetical protein
LLNQNKIELTDGKEDDQQQWPVGKREFAKSNYSGTFLLNTDTKSPNQRGVLISEVVFFTRGQATKDH